MMNELLKIGSFTVYGYGLMIAIGIAAAYLVAEYRAKKMNLDQERIFALTGWCVIGGVIGAKLLFYITEIKEIISNPRIMLNIADGFVIYGGIIGGIIAGFLYCRKAKLDILKYFDLMIPSVALAQGFGRMGCFLAGCCYGIETTSPIGIVFHDSAFAPNGVHLVPTQLISSGLNFLNFFALIIFAKYKKADGQVVGLYLIFYSAGRFIIEFFRGDLIRGKIGDLYTSQFISIFMFAIGCAIFLASAYSVKKKGKNVNS